MKTILLDTHAAIWGADGALGKAAQAIVEEAMARDAVLISPVTAWEIGTLVSKGRLRLTVPISDFVRRIFVESDITLASLTMEIALASTMLPGDPHGDPMDRILIATAAAYGAELMTHDRKILAYAKKTKHIRCVAC